MNIARVSQPKGGSAGMADGGEPIKTIEWDEKGYPTPGSLKRLRKALKDKDCEKTIVAFYEALGENFYHDYCGPEQVEIRGEAREVWAYHTLGWSGNEDIIAVLENSWLFDWLLERYDSGGHYYFLPKKWTDKASKRGDKP